jgi:hypothetical protein
MGVAARMIMRQSSQSAVHAGPGSILRSVRIHRTADEDVAVRPYGGGVLSLLAPEVRLRRLRESWRTAGRAAIVVVVFSLVVGGLTSPAQQYLPDQLHSLANSAGGWSMFAFLAVWLSRARPALGALLGAVSFVTMVEAYGLVSLWRGYFFADPFSSMWVPIGLCAGPVIGAAASLVRHASVPWMFAGVGVLSLVLLAEGVYGLTVVRDTTSPVYWRLEMAAAVGFLAGAVIRRAPVGRGRASRRAARADDRMPGISSSSEASRSA